MGAYSRILLPWDSQPQGVVRLDGDNPLVQGIVMHVPFHPSWGMRDIVRGNPVTATGLASINTSSRGISPLFGTSNFADLTDTTGIANLTDPVTIAWAQKFVSPVSNNTVLMWKPLAAPRTALIGYQGTSSAYRFSFGTSVNEWNFSSVASPVDGVERVCVLVCRGGLESATAGDFSVFIDGVDQGTPAGTTFGANTTAGMRVGATLAGGDPFEGGISRLTIWNRPLLERDALEWSASPDGIYEPQTIWVPVSAGGGTGISGTLSATLADATTTATGALALAGTLSKTLDNATLSATGTLPIVGTASPTLDALTSTATGTLPLVGTLTKTLDDATLAATGSLQATGSGDVAATLADATLAATGTLPITGTVSQTLAALTSSAAGTLLIQGAASITLDAVTTDAAGTSQAVTIGTLTATLDDVTASATGTALITGSASITLGDCTIVATATMPLAGISGEVTQTLEALTSAATGTLVITGAVGATLANCTLVAAGNDPSTDTNSAWWTYTVAADDLTFTIPADDLTYSIDATTLAGAST